MATQAKRIQTVDVSLPAEAGSLARIYSGFREEGINVIASWGYEMGPGQAQAHFYVTDMEKTKTTLKKMGLKPTLTNAVWFEGSDKVGAYAEVLGKVAKAGINIGATDAFAIDGRFASVLFTTNEKDFTPLCKALNI
jgi:hypothetical protein